MSSPQELKSTQPGLPQAVATHLKLSGWLADEGVAMVQDQQQHQRGSAQGLGGVPGLTITSFHLQQLCASVHVRGH